MNENYDGTPRVESVHNETDTDSATARQQSSEGVVGTAHLVADGGQWGRVDLPQGWIGKIVHVIGPIEGEE